MESEKSFSEDCRIAVRGASLAGRVVRLAAPVHGAVVFGLVGAEARFTSHNNFVALSLARAGFEVLVVELLTEEEDARRDPDHPDLPLLVERFCAAADSFAARGGLASEGVGLVGVGAVGAAALVAATTRPELARAVVCAATPLELAGTAVMLSLTPTLVIVGDADPAALLGSKVVPRMRCEHQLEVVPGAGPRLVEPGALDRVVRVAATWLRARLTPASRLLTRLAIPIMNGEFARAAAEAEAPPPQALPVSPGP
jgi:hypothetical protein